MKRIPNGAWVVVADGVHARVCHNVGNGFEVRLREDRVIEPAEEPETPAGHVPPEATASYIAEAAFAKQLARFINAAALRHDFDDLVLVADPETLGQMRRLLHGEVNKRMVGELAKTLTTQPLEVIDRVLTAAVD